ncbi:MAG: hypothetical protein MJ207_00820 [Bacilli bacterium]|nr:hypothetical protein [Bacilli bacterium]
MASYNFTKNQKPNEQKPVEPEKPKKPKKKIFHTYSSFSYVKPKFGIIICSIVFAIATAMMIVFATVINNTDGYATTDAVIRRIEEDWRAGQQEMIVYVDYTVDETSYIDKELGSYYAGMHEGQHLEIWYKIEDPNQIKLVDNVTIMVPYIVSGIIMGITATCIVVYVVKMVKAKKNPVITV